MSSDTLLEINLTSLAIFFFVILLSWFWLTKSPKNFPPSPSLALPFLGHLHLIGSNPRKRFKEWNKTLGDIFSLKMGRDHVVVLNGFGLIKEVLSKKGDAFAARPVVDFMNVHFTNRRKGIGFSSGSHWKAQRSTALTILRNLGMGKNVLAENVSEEIKSLIEEIRSTKGRPINLKDTISTSISNIICSLIFGKRFEKDDPKFLKLISLLNTFNHVFNGVTIINYWHFLKYVPFDPFKGKIMISTCNALEEFADNMVKEVSLKGEDINSNNYILAYLEEMKKKNAAENTNFLDKISLARSIDDLFSGGTDTTSITILWCILYSLHYPDIQEIVHQEIIEQVGTNRVPSINDKIKLKYLNAYIMETQRIASITPFAGPHLCTEEATIGRFDIPKGTIILPSLDSVLHDAGIWGDPQNFRPERFIDSQGILKTPEEFIPFSIGKRVCIGESLAKMEMFLCMANLFQRFKFTPVDNHFLPPLVESFGILTPPLPFEVKCVEREL